MSKSFCLWILVLVVATVGTDGAVSGSKDVTEDVVTVGSTFSKTTSLRVIAATHSANQRALSALPYKKPEKDEMYEEERLGGGIRKLGGSIYGYTTADEPYITGGHDVPVHDDHGDNWSDINYEEKTNGYGHDDYDHEPNYGNGNGLRGGGYGYGYGDDDDDDDGDDDDDDDDDDGPSLTPKPTPALTSNPTLSPVDLSRCTIVIEPNAQSGFPQCNVCGEGNVMRNPDAVLVEFPVGDVDVSVSCGCADLGGQLGYIPACGYVQAIVAAARVCDCGR
jgi:hypothetical protein